MSLHSDISSYLELVFPVNGRSTESMLFSELFSSYYSCAFQAHPHYALPHTSLRRVTHHPALLTFVGQFHHPKKKLSGYYHHSFGL